MEAQTSKDRRRKLIQLIHIGRAQVGLEEEDYRAMLEGLSGERSSAHMSIPQLEEALKALRSMGFRVRKRLPVRPQDKGYATDKQLAYIKGMWELCARVKTEKALAAFVKRITGAEALRFLTACTARSVILALRKMMWKAGYNPDGMEE